MSALGIAALIAALAGAAGLGGTIWNSIGSGRQEYDESEIRSKMDDSTRNLWDSLTASQRQAIIENYYEEDSDSWANLFGFGGGKLERVDTERLLEDLADFEPMRAAYAELERPVYDDYLSAARSQIASENEEMYADLDRLLDTRTDLYNDQLTQLNDDYKYARNNLLSQQYQQNAQIMDTFNSSLEKSRRNAIEAGASAGIRIADNVNNLLTVQNKQSATSMETANQLAQMMINQRNAAAQIRGDYANALSEDTSKRHSIKLGSEQRATSLADTNYNSAYNEHSKREQDLDEIYGVDNPLYNYRKYKPKYDTSNTSNYGGN
jgi:hypothetical protein